MKKVLVTGGLGFIGTNLIREYKNHGYEVIAVDNLSTGKPENRIEDVTYHELDITSEEFVDLVINEAPDLINHHAAQIDVQTSLKNPFFDAKVNILGTINVLEAIRGLEKRPRIIYASSAAVYGVPEYLGVDEKHKVNPLSFYGISKHTPEHYIEAFADLYNIDFTILRYSNVYGIGQDPKGEGGVVSILVDKFIHQQVFTVYGDGNQTRDFICVDDIVGANMRASEIPSNCIINIGTGVQTSLNNLISVFKEVSGKETEIRYSEARKGDIKHSYFNKQKAFDVLGWEPKVNLHEGIQKTFNYYKLNK
ncbi:NAD-dependent epimerase/dehydratase family protein [Fredinandcohnia sp. QZ13]|uniref:NAD-dependent epimerase/dehydratase family protein n=1 Tax=Fredinandcohnia sp. QZ13 TaxID=3073144 RepID=UPI0028535B79|nr:NAD-dependent epimerase/dehydratase family protein [Fredinandcohnia sp. QZ13]MDR4890021.1 NAD-dependent epimerase/dehydratase family protein [Fredinandcohnia sp. QZ13]